MARSSKVCNVERLLGALLFVGACAGPNRAVVPEGAPRRPDGVAIDPITAYPATMPDANASDGIVALETPLSPEAARAVVMHFWSAVASEDRVSFQSLFAGHAKSFNPTTGVEEEAVPFWNKRFDALEYQQLAGTAMPREDSIELYRSDQWDKGPLGDDSRKSDVIAVVHVPQISTGRPLTGESITFQLRRSRDHYQIARLTEDFTFP